MSDWDKMSNIHNKKLIYRLLKKTNKLWISKKQPKDTQEKIMMIQVTEGKTKWPRIIASDTNVVVINKI